MVVCLEGTHGKGGVQIDPESGSGPHVLLESMGRVL